MRLLHALPLLTLLAATPGEERTDPFLDRMRRVSVVYRQAVLGFSCTESILEEDVKPDTGNLEGRRQVSYRYLLQSAPETAEVSEYRTIESREGVPVRSAPAVVQTSMPPPFLWATIFDPRHASIFRYAVVGRERRGVADTIVVAFEGQIAFNEGRHPGEWSGRIWIDADRLAPVRLEAEPARQEAAIEEKLEQYRKAFRLAGIRLRRRPRAYALTVEFLVSRYGLNFPSTAAWRKLVLDSDGERQTEQSIRRSFTDYRFFDIQTEQILGELRAEPLPESRAPE